MSVSAVPLNYSLPINKTLSYFCITPPIKIVSVKKIKKEISSEEKDELLKKLKSRFEKNMQRHKGIDWAKVQSRLEADAGKMWSLNEMEKTGGEPDLTGFDKKTGEYIFYDCAPESPKERRSLCYDTAALNSRKEHKPKDSAVNMAENMGAELLSEEEYRALQLTGEFDLKTSSWVNTPDEVRKLGGAIFCDRRFGRVFTYHNGAESYYGSRGFRCVLKV
ncbi:MAG: DUF4256 domain-containing protein [Ignavibacteria bacterium]|nr:DUF4256 domain-containing protein [Ignavibacteria bacterium]